MAMMSMHMVDVIIFHIIFFTKEIFKGKGIIIQTHYPSSISLYANYSLKSLSFYFMFSYVPCLCN
jgi:hypothetical protein